ncbi:MAG: response regulator [Phycisphaeraceae bacterium]|nr:MAG: response regulator [Phycisphaeraceae bacterium]
MNTIGVQRRDLDTMLEELDDTRCGVGADSKRKHVRWPFRKISVEIDLTQPGSSAPVRLSLACRNLSTEGVGLMHNAYVHVGTRVVVHLPRGTGSVACAGVVRRCVHFRGLIHEVGIQFDKPVSPKEFLELDPWSECFTREKVESESLLGCLVVVDGSDVEHKLIKHYLRETQLRVRRADTAQQGFELAAEGCELILCALSLPEMPARDWIDELRRRGVNTPVIVTGVDTTATGREAATGIGAAAFITKPVLQPVLLRAIAEFIVPVAVSGGPGGSALPADHPNRAVADAFEVLLPDYATRLRDAVKRKDIKVCREVSAQVATAAPALGFERLGTLAERVASGLGAGVSLAEIGVTIEALASACETVRRAA